MHARILILATVGCMILGLPDPADGQTARPLPTPAPSWKVSLVARAPKIEFPTAIAVKDGVVYLGSDPMDMPGPSTRPIDKILAVHGDQVAIFADSLWSVMGLEWVEDRLLVVHPPFLSSLRDSNGDGKADERIDLVTGLGPAVPGFNGLNDHVAAGSRLGLDGFLYIAVGDKGIPKGRGKDGKTITLKGGGVIRVRPDGTQLEVVSSGERSPMSVALTATDEIFTLGNDDDSKQWPCSLTHHIVTGRYGYPYEFQRPNRACLPITAGYFGGAGAQGIAYHEDGLPPEYQGNLFFCDWGLQAVTRYELKPKGATFTAIRRPSLVTKGALDDFRPFAIAPDPATGGLFVVDWAYNGWSGSGVSSGRLYRLEYDGPDRARPAPRDLAGDVKSLVVALDHPALSVRLHAQGRLAARGNEALDPLLKRLFQLQPVAGRLHALWALDAIGGKPARDAIRAQFADKSPLLRAQAVRSTGLRGDRYAMAALMALLGDEDAVVRRESAIALGRLGDLSAAPAIYASLAENDPFVAHAMREALRRLGAFDHSMLADVLTNEKTRTQALLLVEDVHHKTVVDVLTLALEKTPDAAGRERITTVLAGLYRGYPEWDGLWQGPDPLSLPPPGKTKDWSKEGMEAVLEGLKIALGDRDCGVREQAIKGAKSIGRAALPILRMAFRSEREPELQTALVSALGSLGDSLVSPLMATMVNDAGRELEGRAAALEALGQFRDPKSLKARLEVLFDEKTPASLVAQALISLSRGGFLPIADLSRFLEHPDPDVRLASLLALNVKTPLTEDVELLVLDRLEDESPRVRQAAYLAVGALRLSSAAPRLLIEAEKPASPDRYWALRSLCQIPDQRAVSVYLQALEHRDPTIRHDAQAALIAIREHVEQALRLASRQPRSTTASLALERILAHFEPIENWRVIGPFPKTTPLDFLTSPRIDDTIARPDALGRPTSWLARKAEAGQPLDLDEFKRKNGKPTDFGFAPGESPDLGVFAAARIDSDRDRDALLLVGSSGSIVISVNQTIVHQFVEPAGRNYDSGSDLVRIKLRKGPNPIVVLTRQGVGGWRFSVSIALLEREARSPGDLLERLRRFALASPGDPRKGERIFFDQAGPGCFRCHSAGGQGTAGVGPDLSTAAAVYDKAELINSVLDPSSRVAPEWRTVVVALRDGSTKQGIIRAETPTELILIDSTAQPMRVAKAEILERGPSHSSIMPSGLVDSFTPVEFADLIAYLTTLKGTNPPIKTP